MFIKRMVLISLIELSIRSIFWVGGNIYNGGYYLIYGPTKTKEEILLEKFNEMESKYNEIKLKYDDEIQKIKDNINNNKDNK